MQYYIIMLVLVQESVGKKEIVEVVKSEEKCEILLAFVKMVEKVQNIFLLKCVWQNKVSMM